MKRLRVALIGTGKQGDSYRVALPTYAVVDFDPIAKTAVVDVPDECYPPAPNGKPETSVSVPGVGQVITTVDPAHKIAATQFFDENYKERRGQFSLDVK